MPEVLTVAGTTPYNKAHAAALTAAGMPTAIYRHWGAHLPDHLDGISALGPRIVHLQWPESVCWRGAPGEDLVTAMDQALLTLRERGHRLVWTMHNLLPHVGDPDGFWQRCYARFAERVDLIIHHSHCGMVRARNAYRYRSERHLVIGHGYDSAIPTCILDQGAARRRFGLPNHARIFLSPGVLRHDKRSDELAAWWRRERPASDILILAGSIKDDYRAAVLEAAGGAAHVQIREGWLPPDDLAGLARAADALLFIHGQQHLTSGSPHLAQACCCPMIGPDTPYNREVLGDTAWYLDPGEELFNDLAVLLDGWRSEEVPDHAQRLAERRRSWQWDAVAAMHLAGYHSLLG